MRLAWLFCTLRRRGEAPRVLWEGVELKVERLLFFFCEEVGELAAEASHVGELPDFVDEDRP